MQETAALTEQFATLCTNDLEDLAAWIREQSTNRSSANVGALERLGDVFRNAVHGPIGIFQELALAAYEGGLSRNPNALGLLRKLAAAYLSRTQGNPRENARRVETYSSRLLDLLDPNRREERAIAYHLRAIASGHEPNRDTDAVRDFQSALNELKHLRGPAQIKRRAEILTNFASHEAERGRQKLAERCYRSALAIYESVNASGNANATRINLAATLVEMAREALRHSREEASRDVEEAISLLALARHANAGNDSAHTAASIALQLGMAYAFRVLTPNSEKFQRSREEYLLAARLFKELSDPVDERKALVGAAGICYELSDWADGQRTFLRAIDLLESEFRICFSAKSRLELVRQYSEVYGFALLCAVRGRDVDGTLTILENGRNHLLRETLYSGDVTAPSGVPKRAWQNLLTSRRSRAALEKELAESVRPPILSAVPRTGSSLRKGIERELRRESQLIEQIRRNSPEFLPTLPSASAEVVRALSNQLDAELWVIKPTRKGTLLLVVTPEGHIRPNLLEAAKTADWNQLLFSDGGWLHRYEITRRRENPQSELQRLWVRVMEPTLERLWELLIDPLIRLSRLTLTSENESSPAHRPKIYILASGVLELLPLHAAFRRLGQRKQYLLDVADVSYFPSASLLAASLDRAGRNSEKHHQLVVAKGTMADSYSAALWCAYFLTLSQKPDFDSVRAACATSRWLRDSTPGALQEAFGGSGVSSEFHG